MWKFLGGGIVGLAVTLLAGFLCIFGADYFVAHLIASNVEGDLKEILGLPPLLVRSLYYGVALFVVALWWYILTRTVTEIQPEKGSERTRRGITGLPFQRRLEIFAAVLTLVLPAAYYGALHWASKNIDFRLSGQSNKCFVVTANEIIVRSAVEAGKAQIDLQTGRKCLPLTPEIKPRIEKLSALLAVGKEILPVSPRAQDFFSAVSGEPLLWYVQEGDQYRFYDVPGFDRQSGRPLEAVSSKVASDWAALQAKRVPTVPTDSVDRRSGYNFVEALLSSNDQKLALRLLEQRSNAGLVREWLPSASEPFVSKVLDTPIGKIFDGTQKSQFVDDRGTNHADALVKLIIDADGINKAIFSRERPEGSEVDLPKLDPKTTLSSFLSTLRRRIEVRSNR